MANETISPTLADQGVTTAPTFSAEQEIAELRLEIARLKARVAGEGQYESLARADWPTEITYGDPPRSGARLVGITKHRDHILERARARGYYVSDDRVDICGTRFNLLDVAPR